MPQPWSQEVYDKINTVEGFLCEGQEKWFYEKILSLPDNCTVIEIGSYHGRSTACMALAMVGTGKRLFCFDLWPDGKYGIWASNMDRLGLLPYITPCRGDSVDCTKILGDMLSKRNVQFAFIDGGHDLKRVLLDYAMADMIVVPGGSIAMHDVCPEWPDCLQAWEMVKKNLLDHEECSTLRCGRKPTYNS